MSGFKTVVLLLADLFPVKLEDALTVLVIVPLVNVVNHTVKFSLSPGFKIPWYVKTLPSLIHNLSSCPT